MRLAPVNLYVGHIMRITKSLTIATSKENGAVTLSFVDEHGQSQTIHIPPQAADILLQGLMSSPHSYRADGKTSSQRAPLVVTGCMPVQYENGFLGLAFSISDTAAFQVAFPKEAISAIQNALASFSESTPIVKH